MKKSTPISSSLSFPKGISVSSPIIPGQKAPAPPPNRSPWVFLLATGLVMSLAAVCLPHASTSHAVLAFSKQTQAAGAVTFHDKGCEHCHGIDGIGTDRGPDLTGVGKRWKKDHIENQIRNGGGGMPPFGTALQPDEVKNLVDYLAAKRKSQRHAPRVPSQRATPKDESGL